MRVIDVPSRHGREPSLHAIVDRLDASVVDFARHQRVPSVAAGVVIDRSLVWSTAIGHSDLDGARRADDRTLYQIASISKTFTATAVLQLRDEGRLHLDDPLVRHIPELAAVSNPFGPIELVTIRQVLLHTSGLQTEVPAGSDPRHEALLTREEILDALDRVRVTIPPGTAVKYSNLGFRLLAELVRRLAGPLHERVREYILDPLGMKSTTNDPTGDLAERQAQGFGPRRFEDRSTPAQPIDPATCEGDGDLWTSVEDLARWVSAQFRTEPDAARGGSQVLAGRSVAEMHRATAVEDLGMGLARGLGWQVWVRDGSVLVGHGGANPGFVSQILFSPDERVGAIVLVNGIRRGVTDLARSLIDTARPVVATARSRSEAAVPPPPAPEALRELLGRYVDADFGFDLRIGFRGGRLVCMSDGDDDSDGDMDVLQPTDKALRFTLTRGRGAGEEICFFRDDEGRVAGLNLSGYPMLRQRSGSLPHLEEAEL